jgi:hypothetical protein
VKGSLHNVKRRIANGTNQNNRINNIKRATQFGGSDADNDDDDDDVGNNPRHLTSLN